MFKLCNIVCSSSIFKTSQILVDFASTRYHGWSAEALPRRPSSLKLCGFVEWLLPQNYSGRPKAQRHPFNLAGHRFRGKNRQVQVFHVLWYHIWHQIWHQIGHFGVHRTVWCYWHTTPTTNPVESFSIKTDFDLQGKAWCGMRVLNSSPLYSVSHRRQGARAQSFPQGGVLQHVWAHQFDSGQHHAAAYSAHALWLATSACLETRITGKIKIILAHKADHKTWMKESVGNTYEKVIMQIFTFPASTMCDWSALAACTGECTVQGYCAVFWVEWRKPFVTWRVTVT